MTAKKETRLFNKVGNKGIGRIMPMNRKLNRREFLKLSSGLVSSLFLPSFLAEPKSGSQNPDTKNIIIIVFDAFSGKNIPLNGYSRNTTPNIDRIAEKAVVYHNHYAGGHWTFPGTSTLLTGVYPWTHRGFGGNQFVVSPYKDNNLFSFFENHYRIGYSHNPLADSLLIGFLDSLDHLQPRQSLYLNEQSTLNDMFFEDYDIASLSWTRGIKKNDDGYANSLFLSNFYDLFVATQQNRVIERFLETFPEGLPSIQTDNYYILDDAIEWTRSQITQLPQPFLGYFHLLPPHGPYKTKKIYNSRFAEDGMEFIEKQEHMFTAGWGDKVLYNERVAYDEYILYVDEQFGRLYGSLSSEFLQNTWIILTSDHGEMFERGIKAHQQPVFYEPVIRIPLMILEPGRTSRSDVYSLTSAVDLLPTLLSFNGLGGPDFLEGKILPPYADNGK